MRRIFTHILIALLCTTLGTSLWLYRANIIFPARPLHIEIEPQNLKMGDILAPEEMGEDFAYMIEVLESLHPDPYNRLGLERWEEEKDALREKLQQSITAAQFYFALNSLVAQIEDAHTVLIFDERDKGLPLSFRWVKEGLVLQKEYGEFRKGDLILQLGNRSPTDLIAELDGIVPSENMYWVREEARDLLRKRSVLEHLGLVEDGRVAITLDRGGNVMENSVSFEREFVRRNTLESLLADRHGWTVEENLGVFYLNVCINDKEFLRDVAEFFAAVRENSVSRIAIDLRGNVGGDSRVTEAFLGNLPIESYKTYGSHIRYSRLAAERVGLRRTRGSSTFPPSTRKVGTAAEPFEGEVYVLTGNQTFSSGNWIAVVFHDNNLGTVVGEPTGNAPSSFGDNLTFQLPNTRFVLRVSYKYFTRPDPSRDPQDALYPHVFIEETRQDLLDGRDPVLEYLREKAG